MGYDASKLYKKKKLSNPIQQGPSPIYHCDKSQEEQAFQDSLTAYKFKSGKQDGIGYLRIPVVYGTHASFLNISDLHLATSRKETLDNIFGYLKSTLTHVFLHGDIIQMPVEAHHKGEALKAKLTGFEEAELLFNLYIADIAEKIKGATGGTHDSPEFADRLKDAQFELLKPYFDRFKIPYFPNSMIVEYVVPVMKREKFVCYTSCFVVILHCYGKPGSRKLDSAEKTFEQGMGIIERFNARTGRNITPDYILGGHFHANVDLDYGVKRNIYNEKGIATGTYMHTIRVRSNGTTQDSNSSDFNRSFPEVIRPNFTQYDLHYEVNNNFNPNGLNKNPKYLLLPTEFPLLTKRGELSTPASEYSLKRREIDFKPIIEKNYQKSSISEMYEELSEKI